MINVNILSHSLLSPRSFGVFRHYQYDFENPLHQPREQTQARNIGRMTFLIQSTRAISLMIFFARLQPLHLFDIHFQLDRYR